MIELINKIKGKRILVAGDVMLDRYWWGSVSRISPEAPVPIVQLERMSVVPGGAANVAVNLAGLGATPVLCGVCGDDTEAGLLRDALSNVGIEDRLLHTCAGRPTTSKTRIVAHHQHVVRIDQEKVDPIDDETARHLLERLREEIDRCDAVILSDYAKGLLTNDILAGIVELTRTRDIPVVVDPKGRDFSKYAGATVITPNRREAAEAAGVTDGAGSAARSGPALIELLMPKAVLITEGEDGMTLFEQNKSTHLDSVAQDVYDVTGAGDTVIAVFTASLAAGATYAEAAALSNRAAGIVVGHVGTTQITGEMIAATLLPETKPEGLHA